MYSLPILLYPHEVFLAAFVLALMGALCGFVIGYVTCYGRSSGLVVEPDVDQDADDNPPHPTGTTSSEEGVSRGRVIPIHSFGKRVGEIEL